MRGKPRIYAAMIIAAGAQAADALFARGWHDAGVRATAGS